ncbi:hypothetical protein NP233_g10164 [Leucocoprinus birnbaumii]|uniref:CFEM domain-containing protein n=1 Tax=Leucocoprinus birnbaumii TaxID=56174 RepID=A0AAD5YME9_9AGAR|nr:hypothetical protein NP233_g10164 [Leucocoprinus birnbaumii]
MIFNTKIAILSLVAVVAAQSSSGNTSTTASRSAPASASASGSASSAIPSGFGLTPCIVSCVTPAAERAGCVSFANITCVCQSTSFQTEARDCLQKNCSATDVTTALGLQSSQCAALMTASGSAGASVSNTASGASATQTSPTGSANSTASGTGAAASTTPTGAASSMTASIWGLVAGVLGAVAAAAL